MKPLALVVDDKPNFLSLLTKVFRHDLRVVTARGVTEARRGPLLVTLGAYLLNGSPVGYFARLTPDSHASHSALCLPVFVRPASPDGGDPEHDPSPRGQHAAAAPPPGRA